MELPGRSLWDIFADGATVATVDGTATARTLDLGYLTLPSGRIVASDPFLDPWNEPFTARVPRGAYLALMAVVHGDAASVMVYFGDRPPVSWRPPTRRPSPWICATGCLMDQRVCQFLRRRAEEDRYERYTRRFREALDETDGLWANHTVQPGVRGEHHSVPHPGRRRPLPIVPGLLCEGLPGVSGHRHVPVARECCGSKGIGVGWLTYPRAGANITHRNRSPPPGSTEPGPP